MDMIQQAVVTMQRRVRGCAARTTYRRLALAQSSAVKVIQVSVALSLLRQGHTGLSCT